MVAVLLLDLLRGLPEEEIGADRGAEDGDERRRIGRRPLDFGDDE